MEDRVIRATKDHATSLSAVRNEQPTRRPFSPDKSAEPERRDSRTRNLSCITTFSKLKSADKKETVRRVETNPHSQSRDGFFGIFSNRVWRWSDF